MVPTFIYFYGGIKFVMKIILAAHTLSISIFLLQSKQKGFPLQSLTRRARTQHPERFKL